MFLLAPEGARKVTVVPVSPEEITISFQSEEEAAYQVRWKLEGQMEGYSRPQAGTKTRHGDHITTKVKKLKPNKRYEVSRAYPLVKKYLPINTLAMGNILYQYIIIASPVNGDTD